jgi:hypothetical protein
MIGHQPAISDSKGGWCRGENHNLKQLVSEEALDIVGFKAVLTKKW